MPEKKREITAYEASQRLGTNTETIRAWVRKGRMSGRIEKVQVVQERIWVDQDALDAAFTAECIVCDKEFPAKRPTWAKYCSKKCSDKARYQREKGSRRRKK